MGIMNLHNTPRNIIPMLEARPTLTDITMPDEFRQDGPIGVWVGVGIVFVITTLVLAIGSFAVFLSGVIYNP